MHTGIASIPFLPLLQLGRLLLEEHLGQRQPVRGQPGRLAEQEPPSLPVLRRPPAFPGAEAGRGRRRPVAGLPRPRRQGRLPGRQAQAHGKPGRLPPVPREVRVRGGRVHQRQLLRTALLPLHPGKGGAQRAGLRAAGGGGQGGGGGMAGGRQICHAGEKVASLV